MASWDSNLRMGLYIPKGNFCPIMWAQIQCNQNSGMTWKLYVLTFNGAWIFLIFYIFYGSRQTHKTWRPLQGVGYNWLFFQGQSPPNVLMYFRKNSLCLSSSHMNELPYSSKRNTLNKLAQQKICYMKKVYFKRKGNKSNCSFSLHTKVIALNTFYF